MSNADFSPCDIWMMSTNKSAPNPTDRIKEIPVATILLYQYCERDGNKFEELTALFEECFEAGRKYERGSG